MDRYGALILIVFISVSHLVTFSTARKVPGELLPVTDGDIISGKVSDVSKTVNGKLATMVGCKSEDGRHFTGRYSSSPGVYVAGIYGSLVLNVLPKGSVPASGPSKRINDVKT